MDSDTTFTIVWRDSAGRENIVNAHGIIAADAICQAFSGRIENVAYVQGHRIIELSHEELNAAAERLKAQG